LVRVLTDSHFCIIYTGLPAA